MKQLLLTRARLCFWVVCLPPVAVTIWGATWMEGGAILSLYGLMVIWIIGWAWLINAMAFWACRPALRALDEDCDPRPLLILCQRVLKQNPNSLRFRVYEGYALFLLGRQEEAQCSAALAQDNPRLWKSLPLLLIWSASLEGDDPRWARVQQQVARLIRRLSGKKRDVVERTMDNQARFAQLEHSLSAKQTADQPQLEQQLLDALDKAGCTRAQVGAHLALGAFYVGQKQTVPAEEHLSFVLARANQLHARNTAQSLLCRLP